VGNRCDECNFKVLSRLENLFSYGTLQLPNIQLELFNRLLEGYNDTLAGYKKELIRIKVDSIVNPTGAEEHSIISYTGNSADLIEGVVFLITPHELQFADEYETEAYTRILVTLQSGKTSWVYVKADSD